jgi:hypothetical protein
MYGEWCSVVRLPYHDTVSIDLNMTLDICEHVCRILIMIKFVFSAQNRVRSQSLSSTVLKLKSAQRKTAQVRALLNCSFV